MAGRNLRMLVIDDEPFNVETPFIERVPVPHPLEGGDIGQLKTWPQHIFMWGSDSVPDFDLLLIDVRFQYDTHDPNYFREGLDNPVPVPFGLLHALPLAGMHGLTSMPFVWEIRSGDASSVKDDPVAVFAYGLLCGIARTELWDGFNVKKNNAPEYFSEMIDDIPVTTPRESVRDLLPRYRAALIDSCKRRRISIDRSSVQRLLSEVEGATIETADAVEHKALGFRTGFDDDIISLRSVFADIDAWDEVVGPNGPVATFLRDLQRELIDVDSVFQHIVACISRIDSDPELQTSLTAALEAEGVPADDIVGVGAIICVWLRQCHRKLPDNASEVLVQLGYERTNFNSPNRILKRSGFNMPLAQFLTLLKSTQLPQHLLECGRLYCTEVLGWRKESEWPVCIRD